VRAGPKVGSTREGRGEATEEARGDGTRTGRGTKFFRTPHLCIPHPASRNGKIIRINDHGRAPSSSFPPVALFHPPVIAAFAFFQLGDEWLTAHGLKTLYSVSAQSPMAFTARTCNFAQTTPIRRPDS